MAGVIDGGRVTLDPIYRFPNMAVPLDGHLRWNITGLFEEVLHGLGQLAVKYPEVASIGIDTWAVDYGLLDANSHLLAEPISYRDPRTDIAVQRVHERLSQAELFAINGLQFLPFNTMYQLVAERNGALWQHASHIVLLPDLIAYWLTAWMAHPKPYGLYETADDAKFWQGVRRSPARTTRDVRSRFREIDRRLADVETFYTSRNSTLAREIEDLR